MRWFGRVLSRGYCAFCKAERNYFLKKHVGPLEVLGAAFFSFILSGAIWSLLDPRTLAVFVISISIAEIFVYARWRSHIVCRMCGFDPVLYNTSPNRARTKVRDFYDKNIQSPEFQLSQSPLLKLRKEVIRRENQRHRLHRVKPMESKDLSLQTKSSEGEIEA